MDMVDLRSIWNRLFEQPMYGLDLRMAVGDVWVKKERRGLFVVIVGRREKECGKRVVSLGLHGIARPQAVWMGERIVHWSVGKGEIFHRVLYTYPRLAVDLWIIRIWR